MFPFKEPQPTFHPEHDINLAIDHIHQFIFVLNCFNHPQKIPCLQQFNRHLLLRPFHRQNLKELPSVGITVACINQGQFLVHDIDEMVLEI
jgi:hypothetical protein